LEATTSTAGYFEIQ